VELPIKLHRLVAESKRESDPLLRRHGRLLGEAFGGEIFGEA